MKTLVVGGQARDIGKTSVVAGIIAAVPDWNWTAVKITGFGPQERGAYGDTFALEEEHDRGKATDSSRFLAAGARRAFWLRAPAGRLGEAMPVFYQAVAGAEHLIIESNSVLEFVRPDVYLMILDPSKRDFKQSARKYFERADAYLVIGPKDGQEWPSLPQNKPQFRLGRERQVPAELIEFIRMHLEEAA